MPPSKNRPPALARRGKTSLGPPPPVMTWRKALPVLAVALVSDLLRLFFHMFWFFGPALFAIYCTHTASGWVSSLAGLTAFACSLGAVAAGSALVAVTAPIGVIMATAVGFIAFLVLGFWIVSSNMRLFKTAATAPAYFVGAFAFGEIPFLGALPVFTFVIWKLYKTQIQVEQLALETWEKEHAAEQQRIRQQQISQLMQVRAYEAAQAQGQQAANDAIYAQQTEQATQEEEEVRHIEEERMEREAANDDDAYTQNVARRA
jgi:hypothetical protein